MTCAVRAHGGQAMVETAIALVVVTSAFLCLFRLSHMLTGKILAEHAAMRVARARAVGFNDFMCRKAARVAVIPVAGRRLWPESDEMDYDMERARAPLYMQAEDGAVARGILEYEGWGGLAVEPGQGAASTVRLDTDWFAVAGEAAVDPDADYRLFMNDQGL